MIDVLIVDDSAAIRKILQRVLQQADVPLKDIYEAGDGLEALAILKQHHVDLVFADINMPNMDGLQLLEEIRRGELKALPVVMVTTEGGQSKVMAAAQLGATAYVRKPFTAQQFRDTLAGLL